MLLKVKCENDLKIFNQIWMSVWIEKGYEVEYCSRYSKKYLIVNEKKIPLGTLEIKDYSKKNNINSVYQFYKEHHLSENIDYIVEIDKFSIIPKYRGKVVLLNVFEQIIDFCFIDNKKYVVALFEERFFNITKRILRSKFKLCGYNRVFYKGDFVIPTIITLQRE